MNKFFMHCKYVYKKDDSKMYVDILTQTTNICIKIL